MPDKYSNSNECHCCPTKLTPSAKHTTSQSHVRKNSSTQANNIGLLGDHLLGYKVGRNTSEGRKISEYLDFLMMLLALLKIYPILEIRNPGCLGSFQNFKSMSAFSSFVAHSSRRNAIKRDNEVVIRSVVLCSPKVHSLNESFCELILKHEKYEGECNCRTPSGGKEAEVSEEGEELSCENSVVGKQRQALINTYQMFLLNPVHKRKSQAVKLRLIYCQLHHRAEDCTLFESPVVQLKYPVLHKIWPLEHKPQLSSRFLSKKEVALKKRSLFIEVIIKGVLKATYIFKWSRIYFFINLTSKCKNLQNMILDNL
ncbi:hypothetical protein EGR_06982 [Echinococcus granulosus]|uniref:Uncharacterized protein n=1 Tax=Echinococcus granulosus TaxID=6210 RepID=W6UJ20_ECHGR|nr:hypothetical protein EGR_06982 [Echinococcus granulosus]EUB58152.1 hypothetical protein EGR_06982 [Echinococcus granulosus]